MAVAAAPVTELALAVGEGVDHALVREEPERAVDGCEAEALALSAQAPVELLRGDVVVLLHQLGEDGQALPRGPNAHVPEQLGCPFLLGRGHRGMLAPMITRTVLTTAVLGLSLAACGGSGGNGSGGTQVVAGFYPLAFAAEEIGGDRVEVTNLTPAGAEPHDVELTPQDVERVRSADVVLYAGGLQPALEEAADGADGVVVDVLDGLELRKGDGGVDPHVWLDPERFARVVERVGEELGREAPARVLAARLRALDEELRAGLADCERRELVTAHDAFGYLADRYALDTIPIAGLSPEAEPAPRDLEEVAELVEEHAATTVFVEPLLSPEVGDTVAREAGAETAVLDPLEGLSKEDLAAGEDYFSVMRTNLEALREGLGCR